jgi:serine protease Do
MRSRLIAATLFFFLAGTGIYHADDAKTKKLVPPPVLKQVPETVDDLRALEKQVQAVVARVQAATVGVSVGPAQGSGVIIKDGYVLTAGHVSGKPGRDVTIRLPDGRKLKGKTLGNNAGIDSGLIKILDKGTFPTVEMGKSADLKKGDWIISIGHPGGFRATRTPVVRLGRVLSVTGEAVLTDCTLVGGDSGGPLFDLKGRVVGIHSRIGFFITQNYHVPVETYVTTFERLVNGESWGRGGGELVQSAGGKVVFEKNGRLSEKDPKDKFRSGPRKVYTLKMTPGALYTIDMSSSSFDSYLRLEDSTGKELARDNDSAGNLDARIVFRPEKEDAYHLIATSAKPAQNGSFTLTVRRLELKELLVEGKVDVLAVLKVPRFVAPELFGTRRGRLYVNGTVFDAAGKPVADKEVQFRWANGEKTLKTDAKGAVRLQVNRNNFKDLLLSLPQEHRALLQLTDADDSVRMFRFTPGPGREKKPMSAGKVVFQTEGKIALSDPMDKVRDKCRHKVHTFSVNAKATYTIDLESTDFDSYLRVEDSKGEQLAEDDDSGGEYDSRIVFRPEKSDTIRIIVTTCDPGQFGAYRLTIRQQQGK